MGKDEAQERVIMDMLPEIYQGDQLLNDFAEIFEGIFLELEQTIDSLPELLYNPENIPDRFLNFVGELVGIQNEDRLFPPGYLRFLIPHAHRLQWRKGTRAALEEILDHYTTWLCGHAVDILIIEYEDWCREAPSEKERKGYESIFGGERGVTVILPAEDKLQAEEEQRRLQGLVELYMPADAIAHVIVLGSRERDYGLGFLTR